MLDFDGRHTLHDVHLAIQDAFDLDDDHLYAFYLSGKYWDRASEIGIKDTGNGHPRSTRSRLFRLDLRPGKAFAYLFDFGDELRHRVEVIAVTADGPPLVEPVLVESVGNAPPQYIGGGLEDEFEPLDDDDDDARPPLPAGTIAKGEVLYELLSSPEEARPPPSKLLEAHPVVLELIRELGSERERFFQLEESLDWDLLITLYDLPFGLAQAGAIDQAAELCEALSFVDAARFLGDRAVLLARAGRREPALEQVAANLRSMGGDCFVRLKAGDVHRLLGDVASAEELYRGVLDETNHMESRYALDRLDELLRETGRSDEAEQLLKDERRRVSAITREAGPRLVIPDATPKVGRNDPCPCGSGKKHKKCCG